jgi:hypothetical protein
MNKGRGRSVFLICSSHLVQPKGNRSGLTVWTGIGTYMVFEIAACLSGADYNVLNAWYAVTTECRTGVPTEYLEWE